MQRFLMRRFLMIIVTLIAVSMIIFIICLLYTSDAADE